MVFIDRTRHLSNAIKINSVLELLTHILFISWQHLRKNLKHHQPSLLFLRIPYPSREKFFVGIPGVEDDNLVSVMIFVAPPNKEESLTQIHPNLAFIVSLCQHLFVANIFHMVWQWFIVQTDSIDHTKSSTKTTDIFSMQGVAKDILLTVDKTEAS